MMVTMDFKISQMIYGFTCIKMVLYLFVYIIIFCVFRAKAYTDSFRDKPYAAATF
jgi:hypothetical protein